SQVVTMLIPPGGPSGPGPYEFTVDVQFEITGCAVAPRAGDVFDLLTSGLLAEVVQNYTGSIIAGKATGVHVQLLTNSPSQIDQFANAFSLDGLFKTSFDGGAGQDPRCFVRFLPGESVPPGDGVAVTSSFVVTFSEPVDPKSVQAFDTFTI